MSIQIKAIHNQIDINLPNEPFKIWGQMIPSLENVKWDYTIKRFEQTSTQCFPNENYDYDVLNDNEYVTFKYFRNIQNDNSAFFDKYRKNWLHILNDDSGENYNRSSVYPDVAEEMNDKMNIITSSFKNNRRGINEEYYSER